MNRSLGIYQIAGSKDYVVAEEKGGMFVTSETLDTDDIEELVAKQMDLNEYELTPERSRPASDFILIPEEAWASIVGS